jgi:hypothetical protein
MNEREIDVVFINTAFVVGVAALGYGYGGVFWMGAALLGFSVFVAATHSTDPES